MAETLAAHKVDRRSLVAVLRFEAYRQEYHFEAMRDLSPDELFAYGHETVQPGGSFGFLLYDADETISALRLRWQGILEAAAQLPGVRVWPEPEAETDNPFRLLYNGIGRVLLEVAVPSMAEYVDRADEFETYRGLLRVRLAIERYTRATGEAPKTLSALVPTFLATMPLDLFAHEGKTPRADGRFVYDAAARTLASAKADVRRRLTLALTW